jgi:hypothetical protein
MAETFAQYHFEVLYIQLMLVEKKCQEEKDASAGGELTHNKGNPNG